MNQDWQGNSSPNAATGQSSRLIGEGVGASGNIVGGLKGPIGLQQLARLILENASQELLT